MQSEEDVDQPSTSESQDGEEDIEQSSSESSESSSSESSLQEDSAEDEDEDPEDDSVDVTLEFFDPKEEDFQGLKSLLQNFLDGQGFASSELVDTIIKQVLQGFIYTYPCMRKLALCLVLHQTHISHSWKISKELQSIAQADLHTSTISHTSARLLHLYLTR